jgi:hypothetical protein
VTIRPDTFAGDPRHDDVVALTSLIENPTKWGLYDRDALASWTEGRAGLARGDDRFAGRLGWRLQEPSQHGLLRLRNSSQDPAP